MPQTVVGSLGETDCGHTTTALTGAPNVFAEFMAIHRIGDLGAINEGDGEHLVITGSGNVDAGEAGGSSSSGATPAGTPESAESKAFGALATAVDAVINTKLPSYLSK